MSEKLYRYALEDFGSLYPFGAMGKKELFLKPCKFDAEGKRIPIAYPESRFDPDFLKRLLEDGIVVPVN